MRWSTERARVRKFGRSSVPPCEFLAGARCAAAQLADARGRAHRRRSGAGGRPVVRRRGDVPQVGLRLLARRRAPEPVRRQPLGGAVRVGAHGRAVRPDVEDAAAAPGPRQPDLVHVRVGRPPVGGDRRPRPRLGARGVGHVHGGAGEDDRVAPPERRARDGHVARRALPRHALRGRRAADAQRVGLPRARRRPAAHRRGRRRRGRGGGGGGAGVRPLRPVRPVLDPLVRPVRRHLLVVARRSTRVLRAAARRAGLPAAGAPPRVCPHRAAPLPSHPSPPPFRWAR